MRILIRFAMTFSLLATSVAFAAPFKVKAPASWKDVSTEKDLRIYENTKSKANHEVITTLVAKRLIKDDAVFANMDSKSISEIQKVRGDVLSRLGLHNYTLLDIQKVELPKSKFKFMQVLQSRYRNAKGIEVQMLERQYIGPDVQYTITYLVEAPALNERAKAERYLNFFNPNEDARQVASVDPIDLPSEMEGNRTPAAVSEVISPNNTAPPTTNAQAPKTEAPDKLDKKAEIPAFDITKPENQELCKDVPEEHKRKPGEATVAERGGAFMLGCLGKGIIWDNTVGLVIGVAQLGWSAVSGTAKALNPFDSTYRDQLISTAGAVGYEAYKDPAEFGKRLLSGIWTMIKGIEGKPFDCYNNTEQWRKICNVGVAVATLGTGALVKIALRANLAPEIIVKAADALKKGNQVIADAAKVGFKKLDRVDSGVRESQAANRATIAENIAEKQGAKAAKQDDIAQAATAKADSARATVESIRNGTRTREERAGILDRIKKTFVGDSRAKERGALITRVVENDELAMSNFQKAANTHGNDVLKDAISADKLATFKTAAEKEKFIKETLADLAGKSKEELIAAKEAAGSAAAAARGPIARAKDALIDAKDTVTNSMEARKQDAIARKATAKSEQISRAQADTFAKADAYKSDALAAKNLGETRANNLAEARQKLASSKVDFKESYAALKEQLKRTPKDMMKAILDPKGSWRALKDRKFEKDMQGSLEKILAANGPRDQMTALQAAGLHDNFVKAIMSDEVRSMSKKNREKFIRAQLNVFSELPQSVAANGGVRAGGSSVALTATIPEARVGETISLNAPFKNEVDQVITAPPSAAGADLTKARAYRNTEGGSATSASTAREVAKSADSPRVAESLKALSPEVPANAMDDFRAAMKLGQTKSVDEMEAIIRAGKAPDLAAAWNANKALAPAERAKALVDDIARIAAGNGAKMTKEVESAVASTRQTLGSQLGFADNKVHAAALDRAVAESLSESPDRLQSMVRALSYSEGDPKNLASVIDKTKGLSAAQKATLKTDLEVAHSKLHGENGIANAYAKEFKDLKAYKSEDAGEIAGLIANAEARGVERATIKKTIQENMGKCTVAQ